MRINVKRFIKQHFANSEILFTNSGRSALQALIEDFNLKNSKMIIPSFICSNVFSTLFLQNNIYPILIDSPKNSFNITFSDIKKAYETEKNKFEIKSLLIVHTFGLINPDIEKISKWCREKKIILIEDCAQAINIRYNGKLVGTFGDAAVLSLWKVMRLPLGGGYIKNNGKINIHPVPYKINNLDINKFIRTLPLGKASIKFLKSFKVNKKIEIQPSRISIISTPKIFDFITIPARKIDIEKREQFASFLYNELKRQIPKNLPKLELSGNFFNSIPLLVNNQDKVYLSLLNKKINCGKMWDNPLSKDKELQKKWKLRKTPNVDNIYSKKIINILIDDPKFDEEAIKREARIISDVVKKYQKNKC